MTNLGGRAKRVVDFYNGRGTAAEQWVQAVAAANAAKTESTKALAPRWSVTGVEDEIAGVTVRMVTPAEIDLNNVNGAERAQKGVISEHDDRRLLR